MIERFLVEQCLNCGELYDIKQDSKCPDCGSYATRKFHIDDFDPVD